MLLDANYKDEVFEIPFVNLKISKRIVALVAAGAFVFAGLWGLITSFIELFKWGMYASFFKLFVFNMLELVFAGLIVWDRKNIIFPAAKVISLIFSGLSAFIGLFSGIAFVYWLHGRFAVALVDLLLLAMLVITMFEPLTRYKEYVRKFWFIPTAILFLTNLIFFFVTVRSFRWNWMGYVENLAVFIAIAAWSLWIANTEYAPLYINGKDLWVMICEKFAALKEKASQPKPQNPQNAPMTSQLPYEGQGAPVQGGYAMGAGAPQQGAPVSQEFSGQVPYQDPVPVQNGKFAGHIDMAMHILFLFLSCGIWQLIWMFKVTEHQNGYCKGMPVRTAAVELLLSMFVPFYWLYWTYQTGKRIDVMAREVGLQSDMATMGLILSLFIPIVPIIMYQSKINEIAARRGY